MCPKTIFRIDPKPNTSATPWQYVQPYETKNAKICTIIDTGKICKLGTDWC